MSEELLECWSHQAVRSLADGEAEADETGEHEIETVDELIESVLLLRLLLKRIFTDVLWDMMALGRDLWDAVDLIRPSSKAR